MHAVIDRPGSTGTGATGDVFDSALAGRCDRLVRDDGVVVSLAVDRWDDDADGEDRWILDRCAGPTLDLGCGPGRLVSALADRAVPALGVDVSLRAVARCVERGATVLHGDAFERLPDEGRWSHVVLADGNIGIGGDPVRLLRRCRAVLAAGGSVIVELEPGAGFWCGSAFLGSEPDHGAGTELSSWFPWAVVGTEVVDQLADEAGMTVLDRTVPTDGLRCFAELAAH